MNIQIYDPIYDDVNRDFSYLIPTRYCSYHSYFTYKTKKQKKTYEYICNGQFNILIYLLKKGHKIDFIGVRILLNKFIYIEINTIIKNNEIYDNYYKCIDYIYNNNHLEKLNFEYKYLKNWSEDFLIFYKKIIERRKIITLILQFDIFKNLDTITSKVIFDKFISKLEIPVLNYLYL